MSKIIKIQPFEVWDIVMNEAYRKWLGIIFHHTVAIMQEDQGEYIEDMHRGGKREGYPPFRYGMGYHFLVNKSGGIETGERWTKQLHGAHCIGYNQDYIGIAVAGNLEHQRPTGRQLIALLELLKTLKFGIGMPHSLLVPTKCPGKYFPYDDVYEFLNYMKLKQKYKTI